MAGWPQADLGLEGHPAVLTTNNGNDAAVLNDK